MKDNRKKEKEALIKRKETFKEKRNKIIEKVKKKWLVDGFTTIILIGIIIGSMFGINIFVESLDLLPLDFSQDGLYSLTDESKERIKDVNKDVSIYFVGYTEENSTVDLVKQYRNVNEKINVEVIDETTRPDLTQKYGIESGITGIIVESGEKSKVLTEYDLMTYDSLTGESISIAEEVFTSSIISVSTEDVPKIYFLEGYTDITLESNLYYLGMFLTNEINEIDTVNPLSIGNIPEDCDVLVINTPSKDFDDIATNAINEYINRGGNILWLNAAIATNVDMPNVNSILAAYGIDPFDVGVIRETDESHMYAGSPDIIFPVNGYSSVTQNSPESIMTNATKVNINDEKLNELNVVSNEILSSSEYAYFRSDFNIQSDVPQDGEETGSFTIAAEMTKTVSGEDTESKLIIFGENIFITDYVIIQNSGYPAIQLSYNKNIILDSIAYLGEREEDIEARESTGTVIYTATATQDLIIRIVIFAIPSLIILVGIIVWVIRKRRK